MELKDHYSILGLQAPATLPEIKKAYRKLALQFHPDKNDNDPYAAAKFSAIKEAYETLTNPLKKEYYLQQRWYQQSVGKKFSGNESLTPPLVLKRCLDLNRYVSTLDQHRMDREGLAQYIHHLLSDAVLRELEAFQEPDTKRRIIVTLLQITAPLTAAQLKTIAGKLTELAGNDAASKISIATVLEKHRAKERMRKYQPLVIGLIVLAICLLILLGASC